MFHNQPMSQNFTKNHHWSIGHAILVAIAGTNILVPSQSNSVENQEPVSLIYETMKLAIAKETL